MHPTLPQFLDRRFAPRLRLALAFALALLLGAQSLAQTGPVDIKVDPAAKKPARKLSPSLASLPPLKATRPLRILLVDDDTNYDITPGDARLSASDRIFRDLVAAAVGGDANAWSVEMVEIYKHGPAFERLRDFNVVIWYTGGSYGGNANGVGTLSVEDEKTVRRYLQEVGGTFVLVSPGFLSTRSYGMTWTESANPFLREVMGVNGFSDLVQRFTAGTVRAADGTSFGVEAKGAVETQFSAVNPDGAAVVFSATLDSKKTAEGAVPVAVAHPFGGGRFVYVGFSLENIPQPDLTQAFARVLEASGASFPMTTVAGVRPEAPVKRQLVGPRPAPPTVQVSGTAAWTVVKWSLPGAPVETASLLPAVQTARPRTAAPDPGLTVKVERWTSVSHLYGGSYVWEGMEVPPGASQVVDTLAQPGSTQRYRVTVTNASGASSLKEVEFNVPPIQDPPSVSASQQSDGTVVLSWPEVPGIMRYQIRTVYPTAAWSHVGPMVVSGATEWRSAPLDGSLRTWAVTSLYEKPTGEYVSLSSSDQWPKARTESNPEYVLTEALVGVYTGNDNKERLSRFEIRIYVNGDPPLQYGLIDGSKDVELKVNSGVLLSENWKPGGQWNPALGDLENIRRHGLKVVIKYFPNFPSDAWKLEKVDLTVSFQKASQIASKQFSLGMHLRAMMDRDVGKLLTERDSQVEFIIDGSRMPPAVQ